MTTWEEENPEIAALPPGQVFWCGVEYRWYIDKLAFTPGYFSAVCFSANKGQIEKLLKNSERMYYIENHSSIKNMLVVVVCPEEGYEPRLMPDVVGPQSYIKEYQSQL